MHFSGNDIGGFIDSVEVDYYRDLVKCCYSERGRLLDGGCFVGSSTRALLAGLACEYGSARGLARPPLIAIDRFLASDDYLVEFFAARSIDIKFGESFLPVFLKNIDPLQRMVEVRAGEVQRVGRMSDDIEIMVVDVSKSIGINSFICQNWLPRLVVGGVLVHQDFYAPSHYWIAASMGAVLDNFSIAHSKVGESAAFRLEGELRQSDIARAASIIPWSNEGIMAIRRVEEALDYKHSAPLRIMRALALQRARRLDEAASVLSELLSEPVPDDKKWAQWFGMALMTLDPGIPQEARTLADVYLRDIGARCGH